MFLHSLDLGANAKITSSISIDWIIHNPILSIENGNFYSGSTFAHIIAKRYVSQKI